jgi:recombination protein RecT
MSTATAQQPQTVTQTVEHRSILDQIIDRQDIAKALKIGVSAALQQTDLIEECLPPALKGQGARLAKMAALEFERNEKLQECSTRSFLRCVVEAAELGLAIDGRLAHAVPYNVNIAPKGQPKKFEKVAQFQIDYKGLIAIAIRSGQIKECTPETICEEDIFEYEEIDEGTHFRHAKPRPGRSRGKIEGAYVRIKLPGGDFKIVSMDKAQIEHVRQTSKAKDDGPWTQHYDEMAKKTVIRRALKLHCDDPAFLHACAIDDRGAPGERLVEKRVTRAPLQLPAKAHAVARETPQGYTANADTTVDEAYQDAPGEATEGVDEPAPAETGFDRQAVRERYEMALDNASAKAIYDGFAGPDSADLNPEDSNWVWEMYQKTLARIAEQKKPKGKKQAQENML